MSKYKDYYYKYKALKYYMKNKRLGGGVDATNDPDKKLKKKIVQEIYNRPSNEPGPKILQGFVQRAISGNYDYDDNGLIKFENEELDSSENAEQIVEQIDYIIKVINKNREEIIKTATTKAIEQEEGGDENNLNFMNKYDYKEYYNEKIKFDDNIIKRLLVWEQIIKIYLGEKINSEINEEFKKLDSIYL